MRSVSYSEFSALWEGERGRTAVISKARKVFMLGLENAFFGARNAEGSCSNGRGSIFEMRFDIAVVLECCVKAAKCMWGFIYMYMPKLRFRLQTLRPKPNPSHPYTEFRTAELTFKP